MHSFPALLTALILPSCLATATGAERVFSAGPRPVTLIELYTSEGCSSCPPAERWLGGLIDSNELWRDFVPVAFHVNYWDHLGWRDNLASKPFTDRQYAYSAAWHSSSVYTPCFVRNGHEWRPPAHTSIGTDARLDAGTLELRWDESTRSCAVRYTPPDAGVRAAFDITVVLLGSGIVSQVGRGENAGRELRHEFVALKMETRTASTEDRRRWSVSLNLPPRPDVAALKYGLVSWVSRRGELSPLQAVGGWIPPPTTSAGSSR